MAKHALDMSDRELLLALYEAQVGGLDGKLGTAQRITRLEERAEQQDKRMLALGVPAILFVANLLKDAILSMMHR